jgi:hypothetical protein
MPVATWTQTVQIATDAKILTKAPTNGFRNDLTDKALKDLGGDTKP